MPATVKTDQTADVQADLSLHLLNMSFDGFLSEVAHTFSWELLLIPTNQL